MCDYDVVIVGGGPAGLTAAVYCARANKKTLVLDKEIFGGKITETPSVKNIPGFKSVNGMEFATNLYDQAVSCGCETDYAEVTGIEKKYDTILVSADGYDNGITCRGLIIATGTENRRLNLENENKFIGRGIHFCTTCDGAFYKGKDVGVIGGGNTAITNAIELARIAKSVTIVQNLSSLSAEDALVDQLMAIGNEKGNVRILYDRTVLRYEQCEDGKFGGITLDDDSFIALDGVFLSIGMVPQNKPFMPTCYTDQGGYLIVDDRKRAIGHRNIYCCGDCTTNPVKQVATAAGDGAMAAVGIINYLNSEDLIRN